MNIYKAILRPLLFSISAEKAHSLSQWALKRDLLWRRLSPYFDVEDNRLRVELAGIGLKNPVGLAAGFDKDAEILGSLGQLGFGYLVCGTILRYPRTGNPRPIYWRYPERSALMNCAGLPSKGLEDCVKNLQSFKGRSVPIIANIGGNSLEEYLECYERVEPWVDGMELSLGCPNVYEPEGQGQMKFLDRLLQVIGRGRRKPLFVKVPYGYREGDQELVIELAKLCQENQVEGLTVSGSRPRVPEPRLSVKAGTLSGKPVLGATLKNVREAFKATRGAMLIKASGGIFTGADAFKVLSAGASSVEIYTSFVYQGWSVARRINLELLELVEKNGLKSVQDLRGQLLVEPEAK